ncbi:hypothetical protein [Alteromonas halophila]|uniref:hypothetical protein n=1 Tax=Alteromonas halophila TaxID=516698 RepID=UPI0016753995|nr:hypothetical protein [Alteromonas halophila]
MYSLINMGKEVPSAYRVQRYVALSGTYAASPPAGYSLIVYRVAMKWLIPHFAHHQRQVE